MADRADPRQVNSIAVTTSEGLVAGLKITAGHRTMSGQIRNLTGQIFYSPVMLTGHIQQSHRNKRKFPRSSVVCDELK